MTFQRTPSLAVTGTECLGPGTGVQVPAGLKTRGSTAITPGLKTRGSNALPGRR